MRLSCTSLAVCLLAISAAAQSDPFHGSWKLNVAKSTFTPGTEARNEVVTYKITGDEENFNADGLLANGARDQFFYTARFDGKEYPSKTIVTEKRLASVRKIDARTRERVIRSDGRVVMRSRSVVSVDGKTLTASVYSVDSSGKETQRETRVFDRQGAASGDPFNGSWKLNAATSKFHDPSTASTSEDLSIKVTGDGETLHAESVMLNGSTEVEDYTLEYDGKDYPDTVVNTRNNMVSLRKVNAATRERLSRNNGKIVSISRRVVSADGRTLTTTLLSVDGNGKETVRQVRVFEKQ
jgi:hypothetical protein